MDNTSTTHNHHLVHILHHHKTTINNTLSSTQSDIAEIKSILQERQTILQQLSQTLVEITSKLSSTSSSPQPGSFIRPPSPPLSSASLYAAGSTISSPSSTFPTSPLIPTVILPGSPPSTALATINPPSSTSSESPPPSSLSLITPTSLYTAASTISSPSFTKISSLTTSSPNSFINNPSPIDIDFSDDGLKTAPNGLVGAPPSTPASTCTSAGPTSFSFDATLDRHIARRLVQVGVRDVFTVPGDFNRTLLDNLIAEPGLTNIGCCNEINVGYAADGVGGLSVINAIAGAYSENLPLICIVGGPNSNDYCTNRILHHTIGLPDFSQELRCFQIVTCYQAVLNNLEDAHELLDTAISTALKESKPFYINVGCNLPGLPHPTFSMEPVNAHCHSSPSPSISTTSTLEPILFNLGSQELVMASPSLSLSSGQFSPPITIFATSNDSIQSCLDNSAICSILCLLKEHVAPGLFSHLHLSKLSFDAKHETLSPNRCLIITSTHRSNSTMSAFITKYTLTDNKNVFRLFDYYDPNKLQDLPRGTTLTTTLYQTSDNANPNPSLTLAWKLITLPFCDVFEAFSIAFRIASRIMNRLGLSAVNDAPIFVEAAVFFQSFNRAFGLSAIRANFREESFNEVLSRSQWKYEMMFGYLNSHVGPIDQLNMLKNSYYFHLQFNSSPIILHFDPRNESKNYNFDPGGTFNVGSIFDLEDKVVFEGMVMIRIHQLMCIVQQQQQTIVCTGIMGAAATKANSVTTNFLY